MYPFSYFSYVRGLWAYYREVLGRALWVLDVTSDVGIPTMAAVSQKLGSSREDILFGFGTPPDVEVAVHRTLTEPDQAGMDIQRWAGATSRFRRMPRIRIRSCCSTLPVKRRQHVQPSHQVTFYRPM